MLHELVDAAEHTEEVWILGDAFVEPNCAEFLQDLEVVVRCRWVRLQFIQLVELGHD